MTIINKPEIAIKSTSDFDWNEFVLSFDWLGLLKECSEVSFGGIDMTDQNWGYPVMEKGYRIINLNLSLSSEDMRAIEAKCSSALDPAGNWRIVVKLVGNLLFMIGDSYGTCNAVVRFLPNETGYLAVEYLEDTATINVTEPDQSAWYAAQILSDLLPTRRLKQIDENDSDKGWVWQDVEHAA